eukprot:2127656-Prymnesium_polylepis.2
MPIYCRLRVPAVYSRCERDIRDLNARPRDDLRAPQRPGDEFASERVPAVSPAHPSDRASRAVSVSRSVVEQSAQSADEPLLRLYAAVSCANGV